MSETVKRLLHDIPGIRISVIAHGDYCDASSTYVTKTMDFSSDEKKLCDFVNNVTATGESLGMWLVLYMTPRIPVSTFCAYKGYH